MSNISNVFPLRAKNMFDVTQMFDTTNYLVCVNYLIFDSNKRLIIDTGTSRVCGKNHLKPSIHAEEMAIKFCLKYNKKLKKNNKNLNRYKIIIWKFNKGRNIKPAKCCSSCTKFAKKYNFLRNMYTIEKNNIVSAIISNPKPSMGNLSRSKKTI